MHLQRGLYSLLGTRAVLLSIAFSYVAASPSLSSKPMPSTIEPSTATISGIDFPVPTTTEDPVKEARILGELATDRKSVTEVRRVRSLLEKSRARQARRFRESQARRSQKEKAEDDETYAELKQWEEKRRQLNQRAHPQSRQRKPPTIVELNSGAGLDPYLYQGDIRMSEQLALEVLELDEADKKAPIKAGIPSRRRRQVMNPVANSWNLWPFGDVYYAFDNSVNSTYRALIRQAMGTWSAATCLAFYEDNTKPYTMVFNAATTGCNAPIGLTQGVKNHTVSLNTNGCMQIGIIAHEIGHNVGMFHSMSRDDRGDTVWIYSSTVDPSMLHNYNKVPASQQQSFGIPYDMGSLMHYNRSSF